MNTQAIVKSTLIWNLFSLPVYVSLCPIEISPQDFGYEINEDELASEMRVQLPDDLIWQPIPEVDPDDFETVYNWFLS
ncbi:MAG TPA: hypothetical protein VI755_06710 [Anaerolineales bacterium]|nr:hypothetical protein [Anaerolineales bacterium]